MIVHNLLIKLKDASGNNIAEVRDILLTMKDSVDLIRHLTVAADLRRAPGSYDLALLARFNTMADFNAYLTHPAHIEVGNKLKENIAATASACFEE